MITKQFNKKVYDIVDDKAKNAVEMYLNSIGIMAHKKEDYKADITSLIEVTHEVEIKSTWRDKWPPSFKTVHIPYRKHKLVNTFLFNVTFFWVLNEDCSKAWVADSRILTKDMVREIPNRAVPFGELFYDVPIEKLHKVRLK